MKKSTTEDGSIPLDLPKPVEEADQLLPITNNDVFWFEIVIRKQQSRLNIL